jgi:hypothetical protein
MTGMRQGVKPSHFCVAGVRVNQTVGVETRLLESFGGSSRSPFLRTHQRAMNEIRELLFRQVVLPALAPHVAGDDPYTIAHTNEDVRKSVLV